VLVETPKFSAYDKKILIISDEQNSSFSFILAFVFFRSATSGPRSHLRLLACASGGESMAATRVNRLLAPIGQHAKIYKSFHKEQNSAESAIFLLHIK